MDYDSFKIHKEADSVATNMLRSTNWFIRRIGEHIAKADVWKLVEVKLNIDKRWPDLWDKYYIGE